MNAYLGLDIGGTKSALVLADRQAAVTDRIQFPTQPERGADRVISDYLKALETLCTRNRISFKEVFALGVSCGGPLDTGRGLILSPPNLPGWNKVPILDRLQAATGIAAYLQNDANAGALAEWRFGAGRDCDHMVFLTCGTGFGAGLILNGRLYSGAVDMAGEIGHVRVTGEGPVGYGKIGSLEGFCSGGGIAQLARRELLRQHQLGRSSALSPRWETIDAVTAHTVCKAAEAGDSLAADILALSGRYLGHALATLIDLLNPERIVIGSIFARAEAFMRPAAMAVLESECLPVSLAACRILPAALGESLGDLAAIATAVDGHRRPKEPSTSH